MIHERWSSTYNGLSPKKTQNINPNNPHNNLKTIGESNLHDLMCDQMKTSTDQLGHIHVGGQQLDEPNIIFFLLWNLILYMCRWALIYSAFLVAVEYSQTVHFC